MEVVCKRKPQVEEGGGGRSGIWILEFCASQKKFSTSKAIAPSSPPARLDHCEQLAAARRMASNDTIVEALSYLRFQVRAQFVPTHTVPRPLSPLGP